MRYFSNVLRRRKECGIFCYFLTFITGLPSETLYLLSCRESIDGVFDVTWKSIVYDEFPLPTE